MKKPGKIPRRPVSENAPKQRLTPEQMDRLIEAAASADPDYRPAKCGPKATAQGKIEAVGIDYICDLVRGGIPLLDISKTIGVSVGAFCGWYYSDPEKLAQINDARKAAADFYAQKAEQALLNETDPLFIPRARALAEQYRWMAKMFNQRAYGDKQEIKVESKVELSLAQVEERLKAILGSNV